MDPMPMPAVPPASSADVRVPWHASLRTRLMVWVGLLLALLLEYAVAPRILTRENLRLWHGTGTAIYSLQWLCATVVLWRQAGATRAQS